MSRAIILSFRPLSAYTERRLARELGADGVRYLAPPGGDNEVVWGLEGAIVYVIPPSRPVEAMRAGLSVARSQADRIVVFNPDQ